MVDIGRIVAELRKERDRLDQAIAALDGLSATGSTTVASNRAAPAKRKSGGLTPEGRKRLSEMMKRRWAERRRKVSKERK
jgi:hypothetical protein